ncbi:PcfJ domain-containing protein [Streptomyces sp. NPDC002221]|uniref:PcfJ domain-containing protein n=1 Tax=Streptomyces sp. NPDC002221 TaxID=3364639 RepID=UPI0036A328B8
MSENTERVLLHVKFLNDRIEPTIESVRTGTSLRVVARTALDGRVTVAGSVSHRVHRMRASGKVSRHWQTVRAFSLFRTQAGLVVLRVLDKAIRKNSTQHLFVGGEHLLAQLLRELGEQTLLEAVCRDAWDTLDQNVRAVEGPAFEGPGMRAQMCLLLQDLQGEALRLIGDLPVASERFPLLKQISARGLGHSGQMYFLDATAYKAVAENVFGKSRYRRPLAREIERLAEHTLPRLDRPDDLFHDMSVLNWFRLFRGLVPIDWIVDSMRGTVNYTGMVLSPAELVQARALFLRVAQPILGRILAEPMPQSTRIIKDTVKNLGNRDITWRDLNLLPDLIKARGQRRIRGAQDLETLVRSMPVIRVESRSYARSNRAVGIVIHEVDALHMMHSYNEQIARLESLELPRATWELWNDPEFRKSADEFLAEHRRELMTAQQRAYEARVARDRQRRLSVEKERAAWAADVAARLDGLRVGEYRLVVAHDPETLARWGCQLNNCIASYALELGLDVFVAVVDDSGRVRLNIEINHEVGVVQFLGTNNRDAVKELEEASAQRVLDAITGIGLPVSEDALGLRHLARPAQHVAVL